MTCPKLLRLLNLKKMSNFFWNEIESEVFPWVRSFSRIIKSAAPQDMPGNTILISSDYSGDLPKSKYHVFSLLIIDLSEIKYWEAQRRSVRNQLLKDQRRMSFKGLNDRYKQQALPNFLNAANFLNGLMVNIAISKQISSLIDSNNLHEKLVTTKFIDGVWSKTAFNRMATLTHFISILIAGVAKKNQNVYWYSDEDMMFANDAKSSDVSKILGMFSSYYVRTGLGELGMGTTKLNEADFFEEDMNAIPDLVAGCVSEFFDKAFNIVDRNSLGNFAYLLPKELSLKTQKILDWLSVSSATLKKVTVVFDRLNDCEAFKIWRFDTMQTII